MGCLQRLAQHRHVRFPSEELEVRYEQERVGRLVCKLQVIAVLLLLAGLDMGQANAIFGGSLIFAGIAQLLLSLLARYSKKAFAQSYNPVLITLFCLNIAPVSLLHYQGKTIASDMGGVAGEDIIYLMLVLHIGGFMELRTCYYVILMYAVLAAQVWFYVRPGTEPLSGESLVSLIIVFHSYHLFLFVNFYIEAGTRRKLFRAQLEVEEHFESRMALAQAEHKAAIDTQEQAAVQSFVRAVFDVFGSLIWKSAGEFEEPRLYFAQEPNPALDELLGQPSADQPLDLILGPQPAVLGDAQERWQQERQRLWSYAALEASHPTGEPTESGQAQGSDMARKIAMVRHVGEGKTQNIELFVQKSGDIVLFGVLLGAGEKLPPPAPAQVEVPDNRVGHIRPEIAVGFKAVGPKAASNASSVSSIGSADSDALWSIVDGLGKDVSVLVNAADHSVISSTDKFRACFSGPGALKIDGPFPETIDHLVSQCEHADTTGTRCEAPLRLIGKQWRKWRIEFDAHGCFELLPAVNGIVSVKVSISSSGQPALRRQQKTSRRSRRHRFRRRAPEGPAKRDIVSL